MRAERAANSEITTSALTVESMSTFRRGRSHWRSRPYLSTLQPHLAHVQPPHIASSEDVGFRMAGSGAPQRGQDGLRDPIPHRPFNFDCLRTTMRPPISTARPTSISKVDGSMTVSVQRLSGADLG